MTAFNLRSSSKLPCNDGDEEKALSVRRSVDPRRGQAAEEEMSPFSPFPPPLQELRGVLPGIGERREC